MKKIITLLMILLSTSGCYDYHEINKINIVTAIGIDYQNDEYIITLEILNEKQEKDSGKISSYTVNGNGKSIATAIANASLELTNGPNYAHVNLMLLSKSIAERKLKDITDYFLRSTSFRENFDIYTTIINSPAEILNVRTDTAPVASTRITNLIESDRYTKNSAIKKSFEKVINEITSFGIDTCFSNLAIKDNNIILDGAAVFHDFNYIFQISNNEAIIYNYLTNNVYQPILANSINNNIFEVTLKKVQPEFKIDNNLKEIDIKGSVLAKIVNNEPNYDIKNIENVTELNKRFEILINNDIRNFIELLKNNKTDILGINKIIYNKTRKKIKDIWLDYKYKTNLKFNINKKGLIYEVYYEK